MLKDYCNSLKLACGQANDTYKYNIWNTNNGQNNVF